MAWRLSTGMKNAILNDKGLKEAFTAGQIRIFSGPQPNSADDSEQGALLAVITLASGAMVSGNPANGLTLDTPAGGVVGKPEAAVWSGKNVANGSAGWFRWYPNDFDSHMGAATGGDKIRIDGNCATSGGQMNLSSTNLKINVTTTVDNVALFLP